MHFCNTIHTIALNYKIKIGPFKIGLFASCAAAERRVTDLNGQFKWKTMKVNYYTNSQRVHHGDDIFAFAYAYNICSILHEP